VLHAPTSPHFPYTTLFRSLPGVEHPTDRRDDRHVPADEPFPPAALAEARFGPLRSGHMSQHQRRLTMTHLSMNHAIVSREEWLRSEEHTSELQSRENLVCR